MIVVIGERPFRTVGFSGSLALPIHRGPEIAFSLQSKLAFQRWNPSPVTNSVRYSGTL